MKFTSITLVIIALLINMQTFAQDEGKKKEEKKAFEFTDVISIPHTSVKNQYRSGTCWSFSGVSFVESEILRMTGKTYDLSEMFIVNHTYSDKATKYVRLHGNMTFGGGAEFTDVFRIIKLYGMVPDTVYPGLNYGEPMHNHGELDLVLKNYVDAIIKNKNKKLSTVWHDAYDKILDTYLGDLPETFNYKGKEYTPKNFTESTGFNPDNYIEITSFSHHPYYKEFALAIPDNWLWASTYNVQLDDLMNTIDNALENGYTVGWGADVSDKGFSWKKGVAIIPAEDKPDLSESEKEKWEALTKKEKHKAMYAFEGPVEEKVITPEMRQKHYDNYLVTDDHGMQIVGTAVDQDGNKFYKIKNSWGTEGDIYDGYFYASVAFVKLQTIDIAVNKDAMPKKLRKKLDL